MGSVTEDINILNQTRHLGLIIDENLKRDSQIKNMQTKISRALGFLKYAKKYVPLATLKDIYKGIVEPNFNYSIIAALFGDSVKLLS